MTRTVTAARWFAAAWPVVLLGLLAAAGCDGAGTSSEPSNTITGTVSIDGKPLNWGTVEFHGPGEQVRRAQIQTDGTYEVRMLEPGEKRVVVKAGNPPRGAAAGGGGEQPTKHEKN